MRPARGTTASLGSSASRAFWSVWLTAAVILYLFQISFLAIGHWIHGLVGVLWFIGFLLSSLELFLKSRHASEFLEHHSLRHPERRASRTHFDRKDLPAPIGLRVASGMVPSATDAS